MLLLVFACSTEPTETTEPTEALPERVLLVRPYIQSPTPDSTFILWITDEGEESRVEWGLTEALGLEAVGTAESEGGTGIVHTVQLTDLPADTDIHYRVHTDATASEVHRFRTPPPTGAASEFLIVAMSDMQRDDNNPDQFAEIIEEGVLGYVAAEYGGEPADHIGMVLIPGDLVDNGWLYTDWWDEFFAPAAPLLSQVATFPVLGNHESNTLLYFRYFQLPDNGSPGYEEHWWRADRGRVRIFGLDSNGAYAGETQLDWLEAQLSETCTDDNIDVVIAQLHHPYRSELWVPGELDFTGEVIARLEAFTTDCGRPSVHLFGHTHGYSRGQSQDHRHLWVNVASAGGALDGWGGGAQTDYDEFSVSQDEWGFVLLSVDAEALTLARISRGNWEVERDNEVRDSLRIPLHPQPPATPTPLSPLDGAEVDPEVVLSASAFSDDGEHGASQWEVSDDCTDFSAPIHSAWRQHENQYDGVDTQADDDLTDEALSALEPGDFCWRVRYRDRGLSWSDWSDTATFTVVAQ